MTVSVSNDDDDKEAKRFAFSLSFVMTRCNRYAGAAREFIDQAFALFVHSPRDHDSTGSAVPGIPGPRDTSARVSSELICG
ncbi:MAG: hypothetical protein WC362_08615 [Methanoregula sp.]